MAAVAEQSSGVNSKHFFAIAISCGRLVRAGAVMNRENLKNNSDYDSLTLTVLLVMIMGVAMIIPSNLAFASPDDGSDDGRPTKEALFVRRSCPRRP